MRSKLIVLVLAFTGSLFSLSVFAQTTQLPGKVTEENGDPLFGASIRFKGKTGGVVSKADGSFVIPSTGKGTIIVSSTGFEEKEVPIDGLTSVAVKLVKSDRQLDEVVVTALGIRRDKNTLPYAAQQISGDDLNKTRNNNIASGLSGKVSGVQVIQNNAIGGSVNVVIRGTKSLRYNNQALFVVDGVPIDNTITTSNGTTSGTGGYDYGNAAADINPDDIASVNVLKGAAASALYGSRAANGVIMVTTKKAKNKFSVVVNAGVTLGQIDKTTFVKYQKEYGAGRSLPYDNNGFYYFDVDGDGKNDYAVVTDAPRSWGTKFDPNLLVMQWDAFDPASPTYHKATPWVAGANPEAFYKTGVNTNNSVMMDGMSDKGSFKLGYTRNDDRGVIPNSKVIKNIVNFGASYKLTDRLTATATVNYSKVDGLGRYGTGYDAQRNINVQFRQYGETNVDFKELKDAYFRKNQNITWNWLNVKLPATGVTPAFYNNPYWNVYQNFENDTRNRTFGNVALNYQATNWLNILARVSLDTYSQAQEERIALGSVPTASYSRTDVNYSELNYDLIATASKDLNKDFKLNGVLGTNIRRNTYRSIYQTTSGGLNLPGLYSISNSKATPPFPVESSQPRAVDGYFAGATLSYRGTFTLDGTFRRDRSSTLPISTNAYNYYGISGSWTFYQYLKNVAWVSSGKLRANYATVGNDAPWGSITDVYDGLNPFNGSTLYSLPGTKNNNTLKPERTNSKEIGLEMAFLRNRVGFDVSYYHTNTIDQIIPAAVSTATGYSTKFVNAGNVENHGVELSLFGSPVTGRKFSWDVNVNFTMNRNKVLSLYNNSQNLQLASFQGGVSLNAAVGQPYGSLWSQSFQYLNGQRLVDTTGLYKIPSAANNVIGNVNPKWIGGVTNTFHLGNVSFSFLVDVRNGGQVFSLDQYYAQMSGLLPNTVGLNDLGNPKRDPVSAGGGIILPGVTADGKTNTKRVTIISNTSTVLPQSQFAYDASYVKLREVSLSYHLPDKVLGSWQKVVKAVDFSLLGRNLWLIHKNLPMADPEENIAAGNIQGYQSGSYPTVRTVGFNVKLKF